MSDAKLDGSQYEIPRSRGVPPTVRWFFLIGLLMIFYMGIISAFESGHFHVWPVDQSTKVDLGSGAST
jgi:hypothetical protein